MRNDLGLSSMKHKYYTMCLSLLRYQTRVQNLKEYIWKSFKAPIISIKANHRTFFKLVPSLTKVQHSLAFIRVPNHSQNDLDFRSFLLITHCPTVHDVKVNKTSETRTSFRLFMFLTEVLCCALSSAKPREVRRAIERKLTTANAVHLLDVCLLIVGKSLTEKDFRSRSAL